MKTRLHHNSRCIEIVPAKPSEHMRDADLTQPLNCTRGSTSAFFLGVDSSVVTNP